MEGVLHVTGDTNSMNTVCVHILTLFNGGVAAVALLLGGLFALVAPHGGLLGCSLWASVLLTV